MSNWSPANIWGSAEIFSHFFAIFGKKCFFCFMQKTPFFFASKIPLKFHFFRQKKSKIFGFFFGCKSFLFPLKSIRQVHKHSINMFQGFKSNIGSFWAQEKIMISPKKNGQNGKKNGENGQKTGGNVEFFGGMKCPSKDSSGVGLSYPRAVAKYLHT